MTEASLLTPQKQSTDQNFTPRPTTLQTFIGQESIKDNLKIFIDSAKKRKAPLDHALIFGPPGLGKTTLAQIIAKELEVSLKHASGPALTKPGDIAAILTHLQPHDVLFIDEIHRLNSTVEEMLYTALEDFKLDIIIGEGNTARTLRMDIVPFTLVGATTRSGSISTPLRDRFGILLPLNFYTLQDLVQMIHQGAEHIAFTLDLEGAQEIARRCRGTPRIGLRLLRRVRDFACVHNTPATKAFVEKVLYQLGVDQQGLDTLDRRYLTTIATSFSGGPVGVENLCTALAETRDTIEDMVEPYLIQQGWVQRTLRGRQLTEKGYACLKTSALSF